MSARKKVSLGETVFMSVLTAAGFLLLFLLPGAMLLYKAVIPMNAIPVLSGISVALAMFLSTVIFGRYKKFAAVSAGITLAVYMLMTFLPGICIWGKELFGMDLLWQYGTAAIGTLLGIMVAISRSSRRKKRTKR